MKKKNINKIRKIQRKFQNEVEVLMEEASSLHDTINDLISEVDSIYDKLDNLYGEIDEMFEELLATENADLGN